VLLGLAAAGARPALGEPPRAPDAWVVKLDADLLAARGRSDTLTVWVGFADKGESGPAGLAASLAAARLSLSPRSLARRSRAGVWPVVDERDLPVHAPYLDALSARGFRPFATSRWLNRAAVRVPGTRLGDLAALPFVARMREVERVKRSPLPPRTRTAPDAAAAPARAIGPEAMAYGRTYPQLAQINVPALHDSGYVGAGVLVCILDEGFNAHDTHEALRDQIIAPGHRRDFVQGDSVVTDPANATDYNHGTWVMGCIAGNKPGVYLGAAFGASFALARTEVHAAETQVEMLYWGMGAEWADSLGADVLSSSLGYFTFGAPPQYTYDDMDGHTTDVSRYAQIAASKGILVVNAVGNEGNRAWHYLVAPADVDGVIAVGATDEFGRPASFSSFGPSADGRVKPDLAALGVENPLVSPLGGPASYEALSGTSFATPLVAGLAACLKQARPAWLPTDLIRALRETASQPARPDDRVGYGIPNGARALCWQPPGSGAPSLPRSIPAAEVIGPNPARAGGPAVQVRFAAGGFLPGASPARIRVLDAGGRAVRDLWSGRMARGECVTVSWDGRDGDRRTLHPGIYFISLDAGGEVTSARVAWLR